MPPTGPLKYLLVIVDHLTHGVKAIPFLNTTASNVVKTLIKNVGRARWLKPVVPATWEAKAGELLEPGRWRLQ